MKKKVLIGVGITLLIVVSLIGYLALNLSNTAKAEAEVVLTNFTNSTDNFLWCENGYGKGMSNNPWWEQTYLGGNDFSDTANTLENYLIERGYSVKNNFIENSTDNYNEGKTFYEITGRRDKFTVLARVSSKEITLNNCFGGQFPHMGIDISPESYESVIVIQFREPN